MLAIDGAYGEGGGQLLRTAVALAAITGNPVHLRNIRARRRNPGLAAQHLTAVRAVADLCGAEVEGLALHSSELVLQPGPLRGGDYHWDVGTAGSITLVLQAALPVALRCTERVRLHITGGTDVRAAPPLDYFRHLFLPLLARMGVQVELRVLRRGYYPRGGGAVEVDVWPCPALRPLQLDSCGALRALVGHAHVANLPAHIVERMGAAAAQGLAGIPLQMDAKTLEHNEAIGTGGALVLVAHMAHTMLAAGVTAERGVPAEQLGAQAAEALRTTLSSGATLDVHAADQLLIYMALAHGVSRYKVQEFSSHARTTLWLLEQFLPLQVRIEAAGALTVVEVQPEHRGRAA
ncbi:MAG: RNA 3'-terminal phosphate cyclase [Pseudomonadota bacterium]